MAARRGDRRSVVQLLEVPDIVVDAGDENSRTAFFLACMEGKAEIAKVLHRAGASPSARDDDGATRKVARLQLEDVPETKLFSLIGKELVRLV